MDQTVFGLLLLGLIIFITAIVRFIYTAFRTKWWWPLSFLLLFPVFIFAYIGRRRLKVPGMLLLISIGIEFLALFMSGDLIQEQHPNEPSTRTFSQRAFGCSGTLLWNKLLANETKPLDEWIHEYQFEASSLNTETGLTKLAIHAVALSYLDFSEIVLLSPSFGTNAKLIPIRVSTGEYQAVVIVNDHVSLVAIRGTDNPENWVRNFKFIPAQTPLGIVHAGFLDGFQALWPDIARALERNRTDNQPLFLVGHSLGGAIAVLTAVETQKSKQPPGGIITFGQPPVGYSTFVKQWKENPPAPLVRYVNNVDAVVEVSVPVYLPFTQLDHVGELRYFDTTGQLYTGSPPYLQGLRDSVCAALFEEKNPEGFAAHGVRRYLDLVLHMSDD